MLGSALSLTSSLPGAFPALGVGAVCCVPYFLFLDVLSPEAMGVQRLNGYDVLVHSSALSTAFPYLLTFAALFTCLGFGYAVIGLGTRIRAEVFKSSDPLVVARLATSKNEFLQKSYLELKSAKSLFDSLGLAFSMFFVGTSIRFSMENGIAFFFLGIVSAAIACWVFWRESHVRYKEFADILEKFEVLDGNG